MFEEKKDVKGVFEDIKKVFELIDEKHKDKFMKIFLKNFKYGWNDAKSYFEDISKIDIQLNIYPLEVALNKINTFKLPGPNYKLRIKNLGYGTGQFMSFFEHGAANSRVLVFDTKKFTDKALDLIGYIYKMLKEVSMENSVNHIRERLEEMRKEMRRHERIYGENTMNFMDDVIKIFSS